MPEQPTYVTTTITKTFVVPCETGMQTKTATIITTYVKGGKPYTPTAVMTTYVTSVPADWGFGGPVTVTIPVTETKTVIVSKPTGNGGNNNGNNGNGNNAATTWATWSSATTTSKPADPASTWATWSSAKPSSTSKVPDAASTWAAWSSAAPSSTSVKGVAQSTGSADWNTWAATPSASATGVQGVKAFTGAASKTVGSGLIGAVLAGVGLLFL